MSSSSSTSGVRSRFNKGKGPPAASFVSPSNTSMTMSMAMDDIDTPMSSSNSRSISEHDNDDDSLGEVVNKKKKKSSRDRPWKKALEYDDMNTIDTDVNIIGVGGYAKANNNLISDDEEDDGADNDNNDNDDDDDDISYDEESLGLGFAPIAGTGSGVDVDDDITVSSRWSQTPSSPEEVQLAHVKAIGIAAKLAARNDDARDASTSMEESEELPYPNMDPSPMKRLTSKAADHARVRMEALQMLELAERKPSDGYIVRSETTASATDAKGKVKSKAIVSPLLASSDSNSKSGSGKGKGKGVGQHLKNLRAKTSLRGSKSRYERVNGDMDHDDFELNPVPSPIGKLHDDSIMQDSPDASLPYPNPDVDMAMSPGDFEQQRNSNSKSASDDNKKSWSSRYSIDPHMRAVHGGLTSAQVLDRMDQDHYNNIHGQNTSAKGMFKTSPHEQDSRWNVTSGRNANEYNGRLWFAWVDTVKDGLYYAKDGVQKGIYVAKTKATDVYKNVAAVDFNFDDGKQTTLGAHRSADHSSPRQGVFTGVAMTRFLDRLSPKSREATSTGNGSGVDGSPGSRSRGGKSFNWSSMNIANRNHNGDGDGGDVHFSAHDDYVIERQQRRRKFLWALLLFVALVTLASVLGGTLGSRGDGIAAAVYYDVGEEIKFWVTSDIPYNKADETKLARELAELHPRDGDFLIHLGDINLAQVTLCPFSVYDDAANLLKQSPVPVIVLPGNNDWNDCPMPEASFEYWMDELNKFENHFPPENFNTVPAVNRQLAREENFAFLLKGVLFIGLNLVDGKVHDEREWLVRHQENVMWVEQQVSMYDESEYRAIVMLGHAGYTAKVGDFFWPVMDDLKAVNKPVLYLHASDGQGMISYNPVDDFVKFTAVRLEKGSRVTPTQVTVTAGPRPFHFDVSVEED